MQLVKVLEPNTSTEEKTARKYIYESDGAILEFVYIDNGTNKDIVCVPSQTGCALGCLFCCLSDPELNIPQRNVTDAEIIEGVESVLDTALYSARPPRTAAPLASFMGMGEPMQNLPSLLHAMQVLSRAPLAGRQQPLRFAMSTILPRGRRYRVRDLSDSDWYTVPIIDALIDEVVSKKINLKVHLSLHSPFDDIRRYLMPCALPVAEAVDTLQYYAKNTRNAIEIHYTLMPGVNDRPLDAIGLVGLLKNTNIPIKFIPFRENRQTMMFGQRVASTDYFQNTAAFFCASLNRYGITTEIYDPPGNDIGASGAQFLLDLYKIHGKRPDRSDDDRGSETPPRSSTPHVGG